jgi:Fe-S oxidoreductase
MFKRDLCDLCGDCLVDCQWMDIERGQAVEWIKAMMSGKSTPVLGRCITCYACNEICPQDANPFDLIAELQEKYRSLLSEESVTDQEARFTFSQELKDFPRGERVMSICVFGKTDAHLIQGEVYNLPRIGGKPYFCWVLFSHIGAESIQKKHAQEFVDRLAMTGAKEVVCFHDDCYTMLARLAPDYGIKVPFRPVHLVEYLVEYLKANKSRIKPLNMNIAYQRPCASRYTPEKERFIDELFDLAGAKRVERAFDRENALCCAGIKMALDKGDPRPDQEKNIQDAKQAGAQAMVCLCPMCIHSLSGVAREKEMPLIFIGDIVRMAIGEKDKI